jgi:hypothetical protein
VKFKEGGEETVRSSPKKEQSGIRACDLTGARTPAEANERSWEITALSDCEHSNEEASW